MNLIYEYAPTTGLIFFFLFFLGAAYQAYRPSAKKHMQDYALIPLTEDNNHE
jgi:cbb3-type cytochrome oxidase subunit 3